MSSHLEMHQRLRSVENGERPHFIGFPSVLHNNDYQPLRIEKVTIHGKTRTIYDIRRLDNGFPAEGWNNLITNQSYQPLQKIGAFKSPYISHNIYATLIDWMESARPDVWHTIERDIKESKMYPMGDTLLHFLFPEQSSQTRRMFFRAARKQYHKRWGVYPDFVWLPEMAVNEETLADLIQEGYKGTILTQQQIESDKKAPAYKVATKFGDAIVVISDVGLSNVLAFKDPGAMEFMSWLETAQRDLGYPPTIAVDGETVGHHRPKAIRLIDDLIRYDLPREVGNGNYDPTIDIDSLPYGKVVNGSSWSCLCFRRESDTGREKRHRDGGEAELAFARWRGTEGCSCGLSDNADEAKSVRAIKRDLDTKLKQATEAMEARMSSKFPKKDSAGLELWRSDFMQWFTRELVKLARGEAMSSDGLRNKDYAENFVLLGMLYNGGTSCSRFFGDPNGIERRITENNLAAVAEINGWEKIRPAA